MIRVDLQYRIHDLLCIPFIARRISGRARQMVPHVKHQDIRRLRIKVFHQSSALLAMRIQRPSHEHTGNMDNLILIRFPRLTMLVDPLARFRGRRPGQRYTQRWERTAQHDAELPLRDPFRSVPLHLISQQARRQPRALRKAHQPHELAAVLLYRLSQRLPHAPLVLLRGRAVGVQPAEVRLAAGEGGEDAGARAALEGAVDEDEFEKGPEGPLEAAGLDFEYHG